MRTEGIAEQLRLHPKVKAEADEGYRGLANEFPDQVSAQPTKPEDDAPLGERHACASSADANPPAGSAWSMSSEKKGRGARCSGTSDGASTTPRTTPPSPAWSPTAPPADRPRRRTSAELGPVHRTAC
ncbi:hypothetical protein ACIA98_02810 [Streptomyces sp. NPDC051366]|uniref:hypothetical protein n=1 Tax=Streptomyces sp. NPDC051366 TaxID=3365652 RepID=UPI0037AAE1D9